MDVIDVAAYKEVCDAKTDHVLIDVRQQEEWDICHLEHARLIPLHTIPQAVADLEELKKQKVYCICHHGGRSQQAAMFLEAQGFTDVTNVMGGMHAWATQLDPDMPTY